MNVYRINKNPLFGVVSLHGPTGPCYPPRLVYIYRSSLLHNIVILNILPGTCFTPINFTVIDQGGQMRNK